MPSWCPAQVETQLSKTKNSKKAKPNDPIESSQDGDADQLFSSSFRHGLAADMPPRAADAPQTLRQPSIPEGQEYSSLPDVDDPPFTLPISNMSSDTRLLPQIMESMGSSAMPDPTMMENMGSNAMPDPQMMGNLDLGLDTNFSWEMIGLGLEEPMPTQEAIDELYGMRLLRCHVLITL